MALIDGYEYAEVADISRAIEEEQLNTVVPTSRTYEVVDNRIVGMIDEIPAMAQAVDKALRTVRFEEVIYSDNYGSELESLIGQSMLFAEADVERIVSDCLLADDRIEAIEDFTIISAVKNVLRVSFVVRTVDNLFPINTEVNIDES